MSRRKRGLRLHQVILRVKDLERSKQFYTKKLGFKVKYNFSPEYLAVVTPNRLQIGFHPGNQSRSGKAHGDPACWNRVRSRRCRCVVRNTKETGCQVHRETHERLGREGRTIPRP